MRLPHDTAYSFYSLSRNTFSCIGLCFRPPDIQYLLKGISNYFPLQLVLDFRPRDSKVLWKLSSLWLEQQEVQDFTVGETMCIGM